ncbi:hypothetical protein CYLTODRAFT_491533 [Cylindrobasidium torrendii FP15055 ss-10]|uniref:Uncharacterized protein n=1 Tax=Cylindrobasidium torrendii FP15055 ss-10 TaxID=1314674 RepID=A0A0D7B9Z6_9AGAR|nr:hypothetical protein CYLTODRAFT_491533 [Cylindrobasidium torrendii FP15055 ss-10]
MFFNTNVLGLLALVASATAYTTTCQTSGASPSVGDARNLANQISGTACGGGAGGSACTVRYQSGSASLNVCGPTTPVYCQSMRDAVNQLINDCGSGDKVGGTVRLNDSFRFDLFHS